MKKTRRKQMFKLVTIFCAAVFLFGCATTTFAAVDLVGRGTAATTTTTTTTTTGTGDTSTQGTTSATATQSGNTTAQETPVVTNNATVSKVGNASIQTGVMEKIYPFLIGIGIAFAALLTFFHLQMNQVRYGKSEKYYKELLDFICACKP